VCALISGPTVERVRFWGSIGANLLNCFLIQPRTAGWSGPCQKIFLLPPLWARGAAVDGLPEHYLGFRGFPDWWQVNLRKRLPCFCRPKNFSAVAPVAAPGQCQPGLSRRGRCGDESDSVARVARVTKCIKWAQPPRCWSQPRTLTKRRTAHETSLDEGLDRRSYSSSGHF
jgi:hypothetical protein